MSKLIDLDEYTTDVANYIKSHRGAFIFVTRLVADANRIDWLADQNNKLGHVTLPRECVLQYPDSLRDAIDCAMKMGRE